MRAATPPYHGGDYACEQNPHPISPSDPKHTTDALSRFLARQFGQVCLLQGLQGGDFRSPPHCSRHVSLINCYETRTGSEFPPISTSHPYFTSRRYLKIG